MVRAGQSAPTAAVLQRGAACGMRIAQLLLPVLRQRAGWNGAG
jgi:hypothetical protein